MGVPVQDGEQKEEERIIVAFRYSLIIACLIAVLGFNNSAQASEPSIYSKMLTPSPLGKDRILALCTVGKDSATQHFYETVLWNEFSERDLVVIEVSKNIVSSVFKDIRKKARHHDYGDELRKKANCKNELEFILIGKDTGVKARWKNDFTQDDLFNRIDAMPMRRFEMRERQRNQGE